AGMACGNSSVQKVGRANIPVHQPNFDGSLLRGLAPIAVRLCRNPVFCVLEGSANPNQYDGSKDRKHRIG
ncbi:MAG: hypothetical protein WEA31_05200, partial [Pirellulales bacterium]